MTGKLLKIDDELTIHYEESGRGERPILFLPGWTMSTKVFTRQLAYFEESYEYRFITFDPRAHGLSSKTQDGHHYEQHGRDIYAFIEKLKLENIVIAGWSFGTLAVLAYVHQYGAKRLSGLIMLDGPPRAIGEDNKKEWVTYRYDDADAMQSFYTMGRLENREFTNREFARWMLENKSLEDIQWVLDITNQTPDTAAALLNATANFLDFREDLIALNGKIPLLYVVRNEIGELVSNWASQYTPSAQVRALGDHLMFWERSDEFNRILTEFLKCCNSKHS